MGLAAFANTVGQVSGTAVGGWVAHTLGGLGRGITGPLLMGLSIETTPVARRAMIRGIFQSIYAVGMFLGPVIAGQIGTSLGTKGLFLSTSGVGLLAMAGVLLV